jgi:hypothetical protein
VAIMFIAVLPFADETGFGCSDRHIFVHSPPNR